VVAARNNKGEYMGFFENNGYATAPHLNSMPYNKICYSTTWDALKLMEKGS
jgi:hypothetical protein